MIEKLRTICKAAAGAVADVLAPADCRVCGHALLEAARVPVCQTCLRGGDAEKWLCCNCCGERLPMDEMAGAGYSRAEQILCETCATDAPSFRRAFSFGPYTGTLRDLIRLHKFAGVQDLATSLGSKLLPSLEQISREVAGTHLHVVAVPLFRSRRQFNQSQQVAEAALRQLRKRKDGRSFVSAHTALKRVRATESQSHLTPAQRRKNVRGAFAVRGDVTGWTVILVDDVYTTGATAAECTRVLREAGAAAVYVVTLARTQPDRVEMWDSGFDQACESSS